MPEASVYEDCHSGTCEHDVGATPKTFEWRHVNSIAQTCGVEQTTHGKLRTGVSGSLSLHSVAYRRRAGP